MFSDDLFEDQDVVEAEGEWDVLLLAQQGVRAVYRNPNYMDQDIPDSWCDQNGHCWEPNGNGGHICVECGTTKGPQPYLMGTPEETFLKNVYHFGIFKALHRHFERACIQYVADEWRVHKNLRYNPHNFVFYRVPYWSRF